MKQEETKKRKPWVFYLFDKINFKQKGPLFFEECPSSEEILKMEKFNIVFYYNRIKSHWVIPQYFSDLRLLNAQHKLYSTLCKSEIIRILSPIVKELLLIQRDSQNTKETEVIKEMRKYEEIPKFPGGGYSTDWKSQKAEQLAISIKRLKRIYGSNTKVK
jgi:hypothetical protein